MSPISIVTSPFLLTRFTSTDPSFRVVRVTTTRSCPCISTSAMSSDCGVPAGPRTSVVVSSSSSRRIRRRASNCCPDRHHSFELLCAVARRAATDYRAIKSGARCQRRDQLGRVSREAAQPTTLFVLASYPSPLSPLHPVAKASPVRRPRLSKPPAVQDTCPRHLLADRESGRAPVACGPGLRE